MFLRAIGIYKPITPSVADKFFKSQNHFKKDYAVGQQFEEFNKETLPKLSPQLAPINYFKSKNEHHYIKTYVEAKNTNYLIVLISKTYIDPENLGYLFFNINQVYTNPTHVYGLKLQEILDNPLAYCKQCIKVEDKKLEDLKQQLHELMLELHNVQEKLLARAEALELLVDRTNDLAQDAFTFHKNTKEANQCACWSYVPRFG